MRNDKTTVVAGDITVDWKIARNRAELPTNAPWDPDYITQTYYEFGGACLLGELIRAGSRNAVVPDITQYETNPPAPGDPPFWHSYTICASPPGQKEEWRIEEFLGVDRQVDRKPKQLLRKDDGTADLVVLNDASQGFRHLERIWPKSLKRPKKGAELLYVLARSQFEDWPHHDHWDDLASRFGRITLVVAVDDLRNASLEISRGLSWEHTADDIIRALDSRPEKWRLNHCARIIVSLYAEGALLYYPARSSPHMLFYDPTTIEGEWAKSDQGMMTGHVYCLAAAIALQMLAHEGSVVLSRAILAGLEASRSLHTHGFSHSGRKSGFPGAKVFPNKLFFPKNIVARVIAKHPTKSAFWSHHLDAPPHSEDWSILEQIYRPVPEYGYAKDPGMELAREIVTDGLKPSTRGVPVCTYANLTAVDRKEIEALRSLHELMLEYKSNKRDLVPLSIGVFGPSGSGKSFAIREIAAQLDHDVRDRRELTFNLSQYSEAQAIINCLHQVRDAGLEGHAPLVFWDEFDCDMGSEPFGWLRYFLAPMQDGMFQAGETTHRVGRAIFVFAGGISRDMEDFKSKAQRDERAKAKDFLSRLKGYLNISTLDHNEDGPYKVGTILRRAILLRAWLLKCPGRIVNRTAPPRVNVDQGVLDALLLVRKYNYGARSMEAIIKMSNLSDASMFTRSNLPADSALSLHVDPEDFLRIVRSEPFAAAAAKSRRARASTSAE